MTAPAEGSGLTCFISSRKATPSKSLSMRLQEVTQWMSQWTVVVGSAVNWSQVSSTSFWTRPKRGSRQPYFSRSLSRRERISKTTCGFLLSASGGARMRIATAHSWRQSCAKQPPALLRPRAIIDGGALVRDYGTGGRADFPLAQTLAVLGRRRRRACPRPAHEGPGARL